MLDYSILDLKNIEISYETGTKIDGVYDRLTKIKNNIIKVINGKLDFRNNSINGYAVLREALMYDEVTEQDYTDYVLYVGEMKITVHPSDVVNYDSENEDTTNFLKFSDEAMTTLYQNPDKTYKLIPVVGDTGIVITVEEVTDETTPDETTPDDNEGGN